MEKVIKKRNESNLYCWLLALVYFIPNINYYLSFLLSSLDMTTATIPLYFSLYLVVIYAYGKTFLKNGSSLFCLLVVGVLYLYTLAFWPQNERFMFGGFWDAVYNPLYRIVFLGLPLLFLPLFIEDFSYLYRTFCKLAWINLSVALLAYFWQIINLERDFEYMTFSYNMLFSAALCFLYSRERKNLFLLIFPSIAMLCIMVIGSRGAMICAVLFLVFNFFVGTNRQVSRGKIFIWSAIGVATFLFIVYFDAILSYAVEYLKELGFESRTIEKLIDGSLFEDQGRENIATAVTDSIWESPLFGHGLFGDRYVAYSTYGRGMYAHNIILEWLCQYGLLIGGILCIVYLYYAVKCVFVKTGYRLKALYICIFSATFFKMFVTGTYLGDSNFYLLIGLIITVIKSDKKSKQKVNNITQ